MGDSRYACQRVAGKEAAVEVVGGEDRASEQGTHAQIRNNDLQDVNVTGRN